MLIRQSCSSNRMRRLTRGRNATTSRVVTVNRFNACISWETRGMAATSTNIGTNGRWMKREGFSKNVDLVARFGSCPIHARGSDMGDLDFLWFQADFSSPRIIAAYDEFPLWSA